MRCEAVDRWLDDGRPEGLAVDAEAHARTCARCGAALEASLGLDALFSVPAPRAPQGFTDRVMARVAQARTSPEPARAAPDDAPALPWWVEMMGEPAAALALGVAAVTALQAPAWVRSGPAVVSGAAVWVSGWGDALAIQIRAALGPTQIDALALGLLPLLLLLSLPLYRWAQRLMLAPRGEPGALSTAP